MTTYSSQQIKLLRLQGLTYKEISEQVGCSVTTVCYHLNDDVKKANRDRGKKSRQVRYDKLNKLKESKPCQDCGKYYEAFLMDYDHLPGNLKADNVSNILRNYGWDKVVEELEKCDLVCCMCHRRRSKERWLENPLKG